MKKKGVKLLMLACSVCLMLGATACTTQKKEEARVYYLNFKPEVATVWQEIAEVYEEETGVEVKVITAASGTYEQVLQSEIAKRDAPTLFQITGANAIDRWGQFCMDLRDTDLYSWLIDKSMAVTEGNSVYGIPYAVEGYGIIYNKEIMNQYFALSNRADTADSMEEIKDFATFKTVVEDMTLHKEELGIDGVFASTSFAAGEDWRWQTHLLNIPVYYEFKDKGITDTDKLELTYANQYKNIFDLYVNNSCSEKEQLKLKTVNHSMEEFALGKVAMVQNGNWGWSQVAGVAGNTVKESQIGFMPIYTGMPGEENQGLCIGTESYFCINSWASKEEQQVTLDFVEWLFGSETGKDYVTNKLGFISTFHTFEDDEMPSDPLATQVVDFMSNNKYVSVSWNFTAFPGQIFKDETGQLLLDYLEGEADWKQTVNAIKAAWVREKGKK